MKENISRFAFSRGAPHQLDSFETEVSIADGVEQYTEVRGRNRSYRHISEIGGLWSFGEIVTMLRTTRDILESSVTNANGPYREGGSDPLEIRFQSTSARHQWFVTSVSRIYWLDFDGVIRISRQTGQVEQLTWTTRTGATVAGISSILWDVNFHPVTVGGVLCTMPAESVYQVVRANQTPQWNRTTYAALGRYGSTADISYGQ